MFLTWSIRVLRYQIVLLSAIMDEGNGVVIYRIQTVYWFDT